MKIKFIIASERIEMQELMENPAANSDTGYQKNQGVFEVKAILKIIISNGKHHAR